MKKTNLNFALAVLCLLFLSIGWMPEAAAQVTKTTFVVSNGLDANPKLKKTIEKQMTQLLTDLNSAADNKSTSPNLTNLKITPDAKATLTNLCKYNYVESRETAQRKMVAKTLDGEYSIRNVTVRFIPVEEPEQVSDEELCVSFNANGIITGVTVTMETQKLTAILDGMERLTDEYKRDAIVGLMDQMCTAYNTKDLNWFREFMSDDAVVITGRKRFRTVKGKNDVTFKKAYFEYVEQNKQQYLTRLNNVFNTYKTIRVRFGDDMRIEGHPLSDRYYAVEVTQDWRGLHKNPNNNYHDIGRLFVVWDFGMGEPQILLRAWTAKDDNKRFGFQDVQGLSF